MVKAIAFDFWGTLVENGTYSPIRQIKNILRLYDIPFSEYVLRFEKAMMTKDFPTLKEAFENVAKEFGIKPNEYQLNLLIGLWNKNWLMAKMYPETEKVLQELKQQYRLVLISNSDKFSIEQVLKKFNLEKYFDLILLSYKEGALKTDGLLLEKAAEQLGIPKEEILMVGDSIESDILPAQKAGARAVLIDRKNRRQDVKDRITSLEDIQKIIR
ncbi:MAG: HAD family hydrolase [Candidatus Woesearchaeota archaeon]